MMSAARRSERHRVGPFDYFDFFWSTGGTGFAFATACASLRLFAASFCFCLRSLDFGDLSPMVDPRSFGIRTSKTLTT